MVFPTSSKIMKSVNHLEVTAGFLDRTNSELAMTSYSPDMICNQSIGLTRFTMRGLRIHFGPNCNRSDVIQA
jgi:hypothetical protein